MMGAGNGMADISTPWGLGSLELPNRLVRSATWEGAAGDFPLIKHAERELAFHYGGHTLHTIF